MKNEELFEMGKKLVKEVAKEKIDKASEFVKTIATDKVDKASEFVKDKKECFLAKIDLGRESIKLDALFSKYGRAVYHEEDCDELVKEIYETEKKIEVLEKSLIKFEQKSEQTSKVFCTRCGTEYNDGESFCSKCGEKLKK